MVAQKKKSAEFKGLALSNEIEKRLMETGGSPSSLPAILGLSPSYTNTLMNGKRPWDGTPHETKQKIARFLGLPVISVLMLAGIVEPKDFVFEDSIKESLNSVYNSLKSDRVWGSFCRSKTEWNSLPINTKILIALLFERATEADIIKKARLIQVTPKGVKKPRAKAEL